MEKKRIGLKRKFALTILITLMSACVAGAMYLAVSTLNNTTVVIDAEEGYALYEDGTVLTWEELILAGKVTQEAIPNSAFEGDSQLKEIVFPKTVTSIGKRAFYGCEGLERMSMGDTIDSIGSAAFTGVRNWTLEYGERTLNKPQTSGEIDSLRQGWHLLIGRAYGDVNEDGSVTEDDLALFDELLEAGGEDYEAKIEILDADGNGAVNSDDRAVISTILERHGITEFGPCTVKGFRSFTIRYYRIIDGFDETDGLHYHCDELFTGICEYDGIYYKSGAPGTGFYRGKHYHDGYEYTGLCDHSVMGTSAVTGTYSTVRGYIGTERSYTISGCEASVGEKVYKIYSISDRDSEKAFLFGEVTEKVGNTVYVSFENLLWGDMNGDTYYYEDGKLDTEKTVIKNGEIYKKGVKQLDYVVKGGTYSSMPSVLCDGDIINIAYSGTYKTFTLPKGSYRLEAWGGKGAGFTTAPAREGGYSWGDYTVGEAKTIYAYVGGAGYVSPSGQTGESSGGYNGGGTAATTGDIILGIGSYYQSGSGGGATHFATRSGLLSSLSSYKSSILLVAGGSGGTFDYATTTGSNPANYGGGSSGGSGCHHNRNSANVSGTVTATGGSQSAGGKAAYAKFDGASPDFTIQATAGSFGKGGNHGTSSRDTEHRDGGPGGGGGYYGGGGGIASWYTASLAAHGYAISAGGGSGYVAPTLYTEQAGMTMSMPSTNYPDKPVTSSSGYARIQVMDLNYLPTSFNGWYKGTYYKSGKPFTGTDEYGTVYENGIKQSSTGTQVKNSVIPTNTMYKDLSWTGGNQNFKLGCFNYSSAAYYTYKSIKPTAGHKYYIRVMRKAMPDLSTSLWETSWEYYTSSQILFTDNPSVALDGMWHKETRIVQIPSDFSSLGSSYYYYFDNLEEMTGHLLLKEPVIVDLTETFGEGNEPTAEWCDENIPFFEGTINLLAWPTNPEPIDPNEGT